MEKRGCLGIANLGNTCYMNAVLQAMRSNKEWTLFCIKDHVKPYIQEKNEGPKQVLEAYIDLLNNLWNGTGPGYVIPRGFYESLRKVVTGTIYEDFTRRTPQDAHEFLVWLLDQMYIATQSPISIQLANEERIEPMIRQAFRGWITAFEKNYSPLTDLVFGMYRIQYTCSECKTVHTRWETFNTLKFTPIGGKSLIECLTAEFAEETIDEYACDTCEPKRFPAKKNVSIWRLPKCLILTAKRFSATGNKIMDPVESFNSVKFYDCFAPQSHEPTKHGEYEIFATVDHHGSHMGGHYTAQAKNFITDMWGHYDDNVVQEINGPSLGRTTYMLFLRIKN